MNVEDTLAVVWSLFKAPDGIVEVRALDCTGKDRAWSGFATGIVSGYFYDGDAFVRAVQALDKSGKASGIYVTLNPVLPDLLARAANRLKAVRRTETTTDDAHIVRRCWLLVDVDPVRPKGISSTKDELRLAHDTAHQVRSAMNQRGWAQPIMAWSGNGVHLLYSIDLPNDEKSSMALHSLLKQIAVNFSALDKTAIDVSVYNASRITKLYGTVARKGDPTESRPHRRSLFWKESHDG